jgi:hypothetical protein
MSRGSRKINAIIFLDIEPLLAYGFALGRVWLALYKIGAFVNRAVSFSLPRGRHGGRGFLKVPKP